MNKSLDQEMERHKTKLRERGSGLAGTENNKRDNLKIVFLFFFNSLCCYMLVHTDLYWYI